jgi:hypothetical protein
VKRQAFAFALTANGVIASQEGPALHDHSLRSKLLRKPIARGIERIKSVRRQRMPGKDRPTFSVLPRGQHMFKRLG